MASLVGGHWEIMYGAKIKKMRKDAGLSQEQLAEKIEVPRSNISLWEKQVYPSLEFIVKVCNALDMPLWEFFMDKYQISADWLITGKEERHTSMKEWERLNKTHYHWSEPVWT